MVAPTVYPLSDLVEVTEDTVVTFPSLTIALLAQSEPDAPGDAKVKIATLPEASLIVPLFNVSAAALV